MAYVPIPREKVLAAIAQLGPCQPLEIRRIVGGDTVLIGAVLSEMAASGLVAITRTKRGGSPFYYDPSHPELLERLAEYLGEKDQRTYRALKEERVLREDALDPLTRVSLGNIPDFSRRFTVGETGYWRHYLVPEDQAIALVQEREKPQKPEESKEPQPPPMNVPKESLDGSARHADEELPAELPEKPKRKRSKRTKKEPVQQTFATTDDPLYARVRAAIGPLTDVEVRKPETELIGVHAGNGPHGIVSTFVWSTTKKVVEKALLKALLEARSRGMPLVVVAEDFPKKAQELIEETQNVHMRKL